MDKKVYYFWAMCFGIGSLCYGSSHDSEMITISEKDVNSAIADLEELINKDPPEGGFEKERVFPILKAVAAEKDELELKNGLKLIMDLITKLTFAECFDLVKDILIDCRVPCERMFPVFDYGNVEVPLGYVLRNVFFECSNEIIRILNIVPHCTYFLLENATFEVSRKVYVGYGDYRIERYGVINSNLNWEKTHFPKTKDNSESADFLDSTD